MSYLNFYFNPLPNTFYKIVSVQDGTKAFTINSPNKYLSLRDFKNDQFQRFTIYMANGAYSFVDKSNSGLFIPDNSSSDGIKLQASPSSNLSSHFAIIPVSTGVWAGKACYIKTFCNKTLQNVNGQVVQATFMDKPNQIWAIIPCDQQNNQGFNNTNQGFNNNQGIGLNNYKQVPQIFTPISGTQYKIVNIEQTNKCWSVDKSTKFLNYQNYTGEPNQKFLLYQNGNKFAFIDQFTNCGLYVENNRNDKGAKFKADPAQHPTSWVQIVRTTSGKYAKISYMIKTNSGNFYDVATGDVVNGKYLHQWEANYNVCQAFLIVPANQEIPNPQNQQNQQNQGFNNQITLPQVPINFAPINGTKYKILNAQIPTKAWTIDKNSKYLNIANYTGQANQKFILYQNGTKFAFIDQFTNAGLYIDNNRNDNGAKAKSDPGQHQSSWFEIVRTSAGKFANTSYVIKTAANKVLDIAGGIATGTYIHQWDLNNTGAQVFLLIPADEAFNQGYNVQSNQGFNIPNLGNFIGGWKS